MFRGAQGSSNGTALPDTVYRGARLASGLGRLGPAELQGVRIWRMTVLYLLQDDLSGLLAHLEGREAMGCTGGKEDADHPVSIATHPSQSDSGVMPAPIMASPGRDEFGNTGWSSQSGD